MWITLGIVGVVVVVLVGVLVFVIPRNSNSASGQGNPLVPSRPSGSAQPPVVPAPPGDPLPPRTTLYSNYPAGCSLLSSNTVQALYPKAVGKADNSDSQEDGYQDIEHSCDWDADSDYVRFMSLQMHGIVGEGALDTITAVYRDEDVAQTTPVDKIEDQRPVPNLGDESRLVYGTQNDGCRLARVILRSQNTILDVSYGGCDPAEGGFGAPTGPITDATAVNGAMTMARDALQHLNSANH